MKFAFIATISILSTLASGMTVLDISRRGPVIRPSFGKMVWEGGPFTEPMNAIGVYRGAKTAVVLLGFILPACTGHCTISFSDAIFAAGSRKLQLFTTGRYPSRWDDWDHRPYRDVHKGTFLVPVTGLGPAIVEEDFGLTFQCSSNITNRGFEMVPVGGTDYVPWDITRGGLSITCS